MAVLPESSTPEFFHICPTRTRLVGDFAHEMVLLKRLRRAGRWPVGVRDLSRSPSAASACRSSTVRLPSPFPI